MKSLRDCHSLHNSKTEGNSEANLFLSTYFELVNNKAWVTDKINVCEGQECYKEFRKPQMESA